MTLNINLTRRVRRRKLKDDSVVEQTRYVLNWRDPRTGEREQRFFERQRDAQDRRSELIAAYDRGVYSSSNRTITIADAVTAWLETKRNTVRPITFATYAFQSRTLSDRCRRVTPVSRSFIPAKARSQTTNRFSFSAGKRCKSLRPAASPRGTS
jgi:hypothetical protein